MMLFVRLHEAIANYQQRTGLKMSFRELGARLGMVDSTLRGIANARNSTTLLTVEKIARVLDMRALDLLGEDPDVDRPAVDRWRKTGAPRKGQKSGKSAKKKRGKRRKAPRKKNAKKKAKKKA
jgi:transcriptional regulator with XRE-family HTH domain